MNVHGPIIVPKANLLYFPQLKGREATSSHGHAMEVLDNLERHFFLNLPAVQPFRGSELEDQTADSDDNSPNDATDKRRDLLRKVTKEKLIRSKSCGLKGVSSSAKPGKLSSTYGSFSSLPTFSKHGPISQQKCDNSMYSQRKRHILSMSDQNLSRLKDADGKPGLGFPSASCCNLRIPLSSRSSSDEVFGSSLTLASLDDKKSVTFPLLSSSRSNKSEGNKIPSKYCSELKLPSLQLQRLSTVEDEETSKLEKTVSRQAPLTEETNTVDIRECVTPVRTAIFNVEHNWILQQDYDKEMKKVKHLARTLSIPLPDKDADLVIRQRLREVKAMVKPRPELWQVWELMDTKQKELIMKVQETPTEQLKRDRRKKWKTIDVLRNAARMTYLLVSAFSTRKAYAEPDETPVAPVAMRRQPVLDNEGDQSEPVTKSTLGFDTQLAMSIAPQLRNTKDIDLILWVLRATKAFCHLFPAEMETELATVVAYEKYDDGRIIARQGRSPDRFYYIMTGKVHLIQDFVLDAGTIHKPMGFLTKGMTTDPNELDNAWLRDVNMVAKGQVEVLLIEKSDFARLQHTTAGPPVEFLRNLELFHEFPCEIFRDCGDALEVKYYSENRIVVEDSNRTPWLHVVKSGCVKVVREQNVRDTSADKLFSGRSVEELGCVRPFSHADAMLGILAKQRKLKNETKNNVEITSTSEQNGPSYETSEDGEAEDGVPEMRWPMSGSAAPDSHPSLKTRTLPGVSRRVSLINIPIQPEPLAVSSRKAPDVRSTDKPQKPETQRKAFLQLDSLKTGDVFGLEHMHNPLASEGPGVVLVSDGAEVIRISKRFFLQHAPNNTMLKIETMQREYMSEDEAMEQLYNTEAWYRYKSALMSRTVRSLVRP